ncbi:MAG: hypothetical protein II875_00780 [Clostridia bacterium]|nr:hypothetical protein [Clostridia bacterium]
MYDRDEKDPSVRYKSAQPRFGFENGKKIEEPAYLLGSADLINWKRVSDAPVTPSYDRL